MTDPTDPAAPAGSPPTPSVAWQPPVQEVGPAPGVRFASHGVRLVAYLVDSLIVGLIYVALFIVFGAVFVAGASTVALEPTPGPGLALAFAGFGFLFLATLIIVLAYFPFFWARSGQTPGMRLFGLYVVRDSDGGRISAGQAVLRGIGFIVSSIPLYLGFIWIFIDPRRRGWHDLIAGTVMIERH